MRFSTTRTLEEKTHTQVVYKLMFRALYDIQHTGLYPTMSFHEYEQRLLGDDDPHLPIET